MGVASKCYSCKSTSPIGPKLHGLQPCTSMLWMKIAKFYWEPCDNQIKSKYKCIVFIIQTKIHIFYTHPTYWRIYRQSQTGQILLCLFQQTQHYNGKCYSHGGPVSGTQRVPFSLNSYEIKHPHIIHLEILSFVCQWSHKITPTCFTNYFMSISSVHSYYTRQSLNENLFVNPVHTT